MIALAEPLEFYKTFLEWYISQTKAQRYLEIGCADGGLVERVSKLARWATGVDVATFSRSLLPNVLWFHETSDKFFAHCDAEFDVILIDGDHSHEQVKRDLNNSLSRLADDGLILMHDTYPPDERHTQADLSGTAWIVAESLRFRKDVEQFTFPVTYGLTLVRKVEDRPWL